MTTSAHQRHWIWRLAKFAVIAEIGYLLLFNLALLRPVTQDLINAVKPEKFRVTWQKAWTWYPFRVHAVGVWANGESRTQQWQLETPAISASIAVLPLLLKRVSISDIQIKDINYKQRPRLKPDRDYEKLIPFFPEIDDRVVSNAVTTPRKKKRPWRLAVTGIEASGNHEYWIMQFKGGLEGEFAADLRYQSAGGPLAIENAEVDLALDTLYINDIHEVFDLGTVKGTFGFAPFVPRENRGLKMLGFLSADAAIGLNVNSLAFIDLFTRNVGQMHIDGTGRVSGHLKLERGEVLGGTDLSVDADDLLVNILGHRIEGEGAVRVRAKDNADDVFTLAIEYSDLGVTRDGADSPVLTGQQLGLKITAPSSLLVEPGEPGDDRNVYLSVDNLAAPDLAFLQDYLPEKWPLNLHGGQGVVHGTASISSNAMDIDITLASDDAYMGLMDYHLRANLDASLKLSNPSISNGDTRISGSYIKVTDAGLARQSKENVEPGRGTLLITEGHLGLRAQDGENTGDLLRLLGEMKGKQLLSSLYGSIGFESYISSLDWIGVLLKNDYDLGIDGSGEISGVINIDEALPVPGTDIDVISKNLLVDVLDYRSAGAGRVSLQIEDGDLDPDWLFEVQLQDASLMRRAESQASINDVNLTVTAKVEDVVKGSSERDTSLSFKISSARVSDLTIFNRYLPPGGPLQLSGGTASLAADIVMHREDAKGWLTLDSDNLEIRIDDQSVRADLGLNVLLSGGVPADMQFDISGSELMLDNVSVKGENMGFDEDLWSARLTLENGQIMWKKPVQLDARAAIRILDTRPLVAMFSNQKKRPQWLLETLTIRDIEGHMVIAMANNNIVIPMAHVTADKMELAAKGRISEDTRDGVVYARYKKLDATMKVTDGNRNINVIRARENYEAYEVE